TLVVIEALEAIQPNFVRKPAPGQWRAAAGLAFCAVLLAVVGVMFASSHPDGLNKLVEDIGIGSHARPLLNTPFADYEVSFISWPWLRKASAGIVGLALIYAACAAVRRMVSGGRSA